MRRALSPHSGAMTVGIVLALPTVSQRLLCNLAPIGLLGLVANDVLRRMKADA